MYAATKTGKLIQHWPYLPDRSEPQVCVGNDYMEDELWFDLTRVTLGGGDISAATSVKPSEISHPILPDGTCSRSTEESAAKPTVARVLPNRKSLRKTLNSISRFYSGIPIPAARQCDSFRRLLDLRGAARESRPCDEIRSI